MIIPGSNSWLTLDRRGEKAIQSRIAKPGLNPRCVCVCFFFPFKNLLYVLGQNTLKLIWTVSVSVKWQYIIYYLFSGLYEI